MEETAKLKSNENELIKVSRVSKLQEIPLEPFKTNCEYCGRYIVTFVKKEYNLLIIPFSIIILLFYGLIYGILIISISILIFQNMTHYCPECSMQLTYKPFYPITSKGEYFSLTFGKCTLVIKKIFIYAILILVLLFGVYINIKSYKKNQMENNDNKETFTKSAIEVLKEYANLEDKNLTWEQMIQDCGAKVMIDNSIRARAIFNKKYYMKIVKWKGYFINAYIQRNILAEENQHLVNLNIRMIPSETLKKQDLVLSMSNKKFNEYYNEISKMKTGSPVEFEGSFESVGDEWRPHHLHMKSISLIDDFMKDKINVTLFKGINFDVSGHLQIKSEIDKIEENKNNNTKS